MFSKKEKYLIRDNLRRSTQIKYVYINFLKKSLKKNHFLRQSKKIYFTLNLQKNISSKKTKNVCLLSGENTSVRKHFMLSRFKLNTLSISNSLQNFRINSW